MSDPLAVFQRLALMVNKKPSRASAVLLPVLVVALATGCAGSPVDDATAQPPSSSSSNATDSSSFPDIVSVEVTNTGGDSFDFAVTVSSPYDTPDRYADGWRILTPDGDLLGEHELTHDHASEQPFTRSQTGVEIPAGITEVVVEGRDQANGYGGQTQTVALPGR
ncbi:hypothetical protein QMG83_10295 [Salinibacterium sp. G-O1]|uniref:hypothetical protein n=1 Tax=Salinibacterium sp. G-O1 TaxID=3046208 RepID=UPI0024BBD13A|nr:hypothetical protein [Salinibacterium sp. G-O1]MDJ0335611.1 hypothetical protein [Salinibacterium sp. G-O1]